MVIYYIFHLLLFYFVFVSFANKTHHSVFLGSSAEMDESATSENVDTTTGSE